MSAPGSGANVGRVLRDGIRRFRPLMRGRAIAARQAPPVVLNARSQRLFTVQNISKKLVAQVISFVTLRAPFPQKGNGQHI
jgi:hypothetical protein